MKKGHLVRRRRWGRRVAVLAMPVLAATPTFGQSGMLNVLAASGQPLVLGSTENGVSMFLYDIAPSGRITYTASIANSIPGPTSDFAIMAAGDGIPRTVLLREGQALPRGGQFATGFALMTRGNLAAVSGSIVGGGSLIATVTPGGTITEILRNGDALIGSLTASNFALQGASDPNNVFFTAGLAGTGVTTSNDLVLMRARDGGFTTIAREGSAVGGGTFGSAFSSIRVNNTGALSFVNTLTGVTNPYRLFRFSGSGLQEVVAEGTAVPGSGTLMSGFFGIRFNDPGQVAFYASLSGTSGGTTDNQGIYRAIPGELTQIARRGQAAPGGGTLTQIETSVGMNNSGRVAFVAVQSGSPSASLDGTTLFTGTGGSLTRLMRVGQNYAPSGGAEVVTGLSLVALNDAGAALVSLTVQRVGEANQPLLLALTDGTETVEVVRTGTPLLASNVSIIYGNGAEKRLLPDGRVLFWASVTGVGDTFVEFIPTLRYRSTFSSNWDTASNWTLSLPPSAALPVRIDPATSLTVTGPAGDVAVKYLEIGGGNGNATLRLNGGNLTAVEGTTILSNGFLTGDGVLAGSVLNQGTITPTRINFPHGLNNSGTVRGSATGATVLGPVNNLFGGTLRSQAGESLTFDGTVTNSGRIEALGSATSVTAITFKAPVTNVHGLGLITARHGQLSFDAELTNHGSVALTSGVNDVFGDIFNTATGTISVTGGAHTTFYDDVVQNGTLRVVKAGSTTSVAVFLGSFSGSGGATGGGDIFFEGDLRPGNSPAFVTFDANVSLGSGTTTLIELAGTGTNQYDRISVTGVLNLAGTLDVQFIDGYLPAGTAPVSFRILEAGALVGDFTQILLPTAGDRQWMLLRDANSLTLSSFNVIPEPSLLAPLAGAGLFLRRRR